MQKALRPKIFITGSLGQIGTSLTKSFNARYGENNILISDVKSKTAVNQANYVQADITDKDRIDSIVRDFKPDWIVHLAAILSANGERNPDLAFKINDLGFRNVLDTAVKHGTMLFSPSTIAVFGPSTPRENTPNQTIMKPETIYGITKVYMELLGNYYHKKHGLDFRSIRYPGAISADPPGGGTTDYIIEMYYNAVQNKKYKCFLKEDTGLPMMHIDDLIEGTIKFLEADNNSLTDRTYNISAFGCTPKDVEKIIRYYKPNFNVTYEPDFRQAVADSWPLSIDYSLAAKDWKFDPKYKSLESFTELLLKQVETKIDFRTQLESTISASSLTLE